MLVAAANPCRCGYMTDPARACARAPSCGEDYMGRISGPLMDRFDLRIDVPPVAFTDLDLPASGDTSEDISQRVAQARHRQTERYDGIDDVRVNADVDGELLKQVTSLESDGAELLRRAAEHYRLSARSYHRVLRVARTIADLAGSEAVLSNHVAEAVSYRVAS
jgi:magnesium chelatase family protein